MHKCQICGKVSDEVYHYDKWLCPLCCKNSLKEAYENALRNNPPKFNINDICIVKAWWKDKRETKCIILNNPKWYKDHWYYMVREYNNPGAHQREVKEKDILY